MGRCLKDKGSGGSWPLVPVLPKNTQLCPVLRWAQGIVPAEGPAQEWMQVGHVQAVPDVCCVMPVLATAHYYSRYEFEVSQRVPKVIMGRHQRRPPLLVAPDPPCRYEDDEGENRHVPDTSSHSQALSPSQMDLCSGEVEWEKHCWVSQNKAEGLWLLSPLPSPATPAMLSVPSALPADPQQLG